ncbi:MAG: Uma2 family endonuclease [Oscillibacter sp.]|nr:Uma2 family endonuclease [Oscillibacter sp.]
METNLAYKFEEERPEEIINGRVVMMASPSLNHNIISGNLYRIFGNYLDGKPCMPFHDNTNVFLEKSERYIPDVMIVCDRDKMRADGVHGAPDLVVEVLSPSTGRNDKRHKKDMYEKHGVREYWIVSPGEQSIEQYVLENGRFVLRDVYSRYPEFMLLDMSDAEKAALVTEFHPALFEDLTIRLDSVFKDIMPGA